jgi:RHS repeat-associated protein
LTGVNDPTYQVSYSYESPYSPTLVTKASYANGPTFVFDYDANGRIQQQSLLNGDSKVTYRYSLDGKSYSVLDGTGATTTVTQTADGGFTQTNPLDKSISGSYDAVTRTWAYTAPNGTVSKETYSVDGRLTEATNALNQKVAFTYDPTFGQLAGFTDAKGNGIDYAYDAKGNLNKITYEDGSFEQYAYSQTTGLLTQSTNRRGQSINLQYNGSYQLTQTQYSNNSTETYGYDAATGQLTSITNATGTTSLQFNPTTRQLKITYSNGRSLSYTFDTLGRRTQLVVQDNLSSRTTNYTYDFAGRLDKLTDGANQLIVDYDYDAVTGRLQKETNGNGTYTTYQYDAAGQVTKLGNYAPSGAVTSQFEYTYNDLGQRTQVKSLDGTWVYGYDATGQLTRGVFTSTNAAIANQDLTYEYDAAGNRVRTIVNGVTDTVTTNNLNQYTQSGNTAYRYDADGNLLEKQTGNQLWKYSYDDQSRLIKVVDSTNNITQYEYDVFSNRSATIYNGTRTEYLVDPSGLGDVVGEYDGSGGLVASYTHGLGLVSRNASGTSAYYDFDAIGSTAGLTGNSGAILNRYSYRPFGEDFYEVETVSNSFEYVGQFGVTEEQNGLDYMRARFYDGGMGRFTSIDPIGLQGKDANIYRYGRNAPADFIDPDGTSWFVPGVVLSTVGGFVAGLATGLTLNKLGTGGKALVPVVVASAGLATIMAPPVAKPAIGAFGIGVGLGGNLGNQIDGNTGLPITTPIEGLLPNRAPGIPGTGPNLAPGVPNIFRPFLPSSPNLIGWPPSYKRWLPPYTEPLKRGFPASGQLSSPLVLDLDNDGIELTNLNTSQTYFDVDGDGFREATGWVKADDGLLVRDLNNDGFINDNTELFGNNTAAQINSGFTKLKTLDTNNDGWISATDTAFNSLQVWRDLDQDGISDTGELFTLNQLNISRISVNPTATNQTIEGNKILETAQYELTNGTQRTIVDAWFALDDMDSRYDFRSTHNTPVTLTNEILSLPDLRGFGELPNLSIAMAQDPTLLNLVKIFNTTLLNDDFTGANALVESILFSWAKVDGVAPDSRLYYVNAQHLGFLEKFMGSNWGNSSTSAPGPNPGNLLERLYTQLKQSLAARLMATYADFEVKFDATSDQLIFNGTPKDAVDRLQQIMSQIAVNSSPKLVTQKSLLEAFIAESDPDGRIHKFLSLGDDTFSEFVIGYPTAIYGLQGNDTFLEDYLLNSVFIDGGEGNDTINGSGGQDTLHGGVGNDLIKINNYYDIVTFNPNDGQDTIQGYYTLGTEETSYGTLKFGAGIAANDLSFELDTQKQELIISVNGSTDKITLQSCVREFIFDNGQVKSLSDFMTSKVFYDNGNRNALSWKASGINFNGGQGNDSIVTGRFNDILNGGTGNDTLSSGDGNDTYIFERGGGQDLITEAFYSYYSNDTLIFETGITKNDLEWSFNGQDLTFVIKPVLGSPANTPQDRITIQNFYNRYDSSLLPVSKFIVDSQEITLAEIMTGATISRDDINANYYYWTKSAIKFDGASGNDTIYTSHFNDTVYGGDGDDIIYSYDGSDQVFGEGGNDTLNGYWGNDTIDGGTGDDSINGGASDDFLIGGSGNDFIEGEHDADTLIGGLGNDTLSGGLGNDTYIFERGSGQDIIRETYPENGDLLQFGAGIVKADLSWNFNGRDLTFIVKPASGSTAPADTITIENFTNGPAIQSVIVDGQSLTTTELMTGAVVSRDDANTNSLWWNYSAIKFDGASGNDTIYTSHFNDTIYGGDGDDIIYSYDGNDQVFGEGGNDILNSRFGNDTIDGGIGDDSINGGAGDDFLIGGSGNDFIEGEHDADTLDGGTGADTLIGGTGNDIYYVDNVGDVVTETSTVATEIDSVISTINYTLGTNLENLTLGGTSSINGTGNILDNLIIGNIAVNNLIGSSGNDTLDGADGNDTLSGDDGNDSLIGGSGNDSLSGGTGNDILDGGMGADTLIGGTGNDSYFVDSTSDVVTETSTIATEIDSVTSSVTHTLKANLENLFLSGSSAINGTGNTLNNQIIGNGAKNSLSGLAGNDILAGAAGDDTLNGGDGNDSLAGDDGNDSLIGGLGNDTLIGGLGNDILTGGAGVDILTGSAGTDRFLFDINAIFNASTMGVDGVTDFSVGTDKVVLDKTTFTVLTSAASSGFSIAGEFASVADNASAAVSTAYIVYSRGTGSLFYNQNGSALGLGTGGEFANLSGLPNLAATDFIIQA